MEKTYNTDNSESLEQLNSQTILFVDEKVQRLENLKKKEEKRVEMERQYVLGLTIGCIANNY